MFTINKTITRIFRKQQQYSNSRKKGQAHYRYFTIYISNYILYFFLYYLTVLIFILTILTISYILFNVTRSDVFFYITNCLFTFLIFLNYLTRSCTFLTCFFYITNCLFYIFNIFILTFLYLYVFIIRLIRHSIFIFILYMYS